MKPIDNEAYLIALEQQLDAQKLETLDFDHLKEFLGEIRKLQKDHQELAAELALFREDYIARIAGMTKAIACLTSRKETLVSALAYIESLAERGASGLCEQYRQTQARFMEAFPASFGLLHRAAKPRTEKLQDYK